MPHRAELAQHMLLPVARPALLAARTCTLQVIAHVNEYAATAQCYATGLNIRSRMCAWARGWRMAHL